MDDDWEQSTKSVEDVLIGNREVHPLKDLTDYLQILPYKEKDLSQDTKYQKTPFEGADAVILTSGNADPEQIDSERTKRINTNSIDFAVKANPKIIIFTSSVWRTMGLLGEDYLINAEEHTAPSDTPYAQMKAESVKYLKKVAAQNPDIIFSYNDLGWYPRGSVGDPASNQKGQNLQFWIAECEMQMHIIRQLQIKEIPYFQKLIGADKNLFGFNVISNNKPPSYVRDHPNFKYDLESSLKLGVQFQFNVYDVLTKKDASWRRIPIDLK